MSRKRRNPMAEFALCFSACQKEQERLSLAVASSLYYTYSDVDPKHSSSWNLSRTAISFSCHFEERVR